MNNKGSNIPIAINFKMALPTGMFLHNPTTRIKSTLQVKSAYSLLIQLSTLKWNRRQFSTQINCVGVVLKSASLWLFQRKSEQCRRHHPPPCKLPLLLKKTSLGKTLVRPRQVLRRQGGVGTSRQQIQSRKQRCMERKRKGERDTNKQKLSKRERERKTDRETDSQPMISESVG